MSDLDWQATTNIVAIQANLVKGLAFSMAQYQAYSADTPLSTAIKMYSKRTGTSPKIVVVPDWYEVRRIPKNVELLSSSNCSVIMITSEDESEFETMNVTSITPRVSRAGGLSDEKDNGVHQYNRQVFSATCPHCKNTIRDWSVLGHYWDNGTPPYWQKLAGYIFKRDKYTCVMCDDTHEFDGLDAHHITPRDKGGADSSDNLITLCNGCHDWLHRYYEGIEERSGKSILMFEPIMRPK